MFASRHRGTVIAKGLKIVGSVTAEGLVEVNGQIDGEPVAVPSLSPAGLMSPEPLQPSEWLWTGKSKVQFKAETFF